MKGVSGSFISGLSAPIYKAVADIRVVWLVLAAVTSLPYLLAVLRTPAGHTFTGVLSAYDDTFTYFAWIRQSADGHLLLRDLFTSEPQAREFFLPLWTLIGLTARVTGASVAITFHVARLLGTLLLLIAARTTALTVMKSRTRVRYTLWLYATSGGLGWLVYAIRSGGEIFAGAPAGSIDLTTPEAIAFRSVFAQVHFVVGTAILVCSITLFLGAIVNKKTSRAICAGLLTSLLALVHPYMVVVVMAVAVVSLLTSKWLVPAPPGRPNLLPGIGVFAAFGVAALPGISYLLYLNRTNEVLQEWLRITDTMSPPPREYLLGFGIMVALAVPGFKLLWGTRANHGRLLMLWATVQAALLYAPFSFQRRLVEGLQVPLTVAASVAVSWIARRLFAGRVSRYRKVWLVAVVCISAITNIGFIAGQLIVKPSSADSRRYVPDDLVSAFEFVRANADPDAVVFSDYLTGSIAPSMTGLRVFLGHYGQTIDASEKGAQVTAFYTGVLDDAAARQLFSKNEIRYVLYGPFERASYDSFVPPPWLRLVSRFGKVDVYQVDHQFKSD